MSTDKYKRLDNVLLHCATLCYILLDCASSCAIFCIGQHDATLICMNFAKFCYIVLHFAWDNMIQMLSSLAWQHDTKLCSIVQHCATLCFIDVLHFAWGQHDATLIICGWQHRDPRLEAWCYIVLHSAAQYRLEAWPRDQHCDRSWHIFYQLLGGPHLAQTNTVTNADVNTDTNTYKICFQYHHACEGGQSTRVFTKSPKGYLQKAALSEMKIHSRGGQG